MSVNRITEFTRLETDDLKNLSEEDILEGFRKKNSQIIQKYFFGYCKAAYRVWNEKYQLQSKQDLDFDSITASYYTYLLENNWAPLEVDREKASLSTWMIKGYYFKVQDALKEYHRRQELFKPEDPSKENLVSLKESGNTESFIDLKHDIHAICGKMEDPVDQKILRWYILEEYTVTEIAKELGVTPSAVSQRYSKIIRKYIIPYFNDKI